MKCITGRNRYEATIHEKPKPSFPNYSPAPSCQPLLFNYRTGMDKHKELTCNIPTKTSPLLHPTPF